jgi:hypothetical protein
MEMAIPFRVSYASSVSQYLEAQRAAAGGETVQQTRLIMTGLASVNAVLGKSAEAEISEGFARSSGEVLLWDARSGRQLIPFRESSVLIWSVKSQLSLKRLDRCQVRRAQRNTRFAPVRMAGKSH